MKLNILLQKIINKILTNDLISCISIENFFIIGIKINGENYV